MYTRKQKLFSDIFINEDVTPSVIMNLSEENLNKGISKFVQKSIEKIKSEYGQTELNYITQSKGDITTLKEYNDIEQSILILKNLNVNNRRDRKDIDTIFYAHSNIIKYRNNFKLAFSKKNEFLTLYYVSVVSSLIRAVESAIINKVEFIETQSGVELSYDTNRKRILGLKEISNFNKHAESGEVSSMFRQLNTIKEIDQLASNSVTLLTATSGLLITIPIAISTIRFSVAVYYRRRLALSDSLASLADFVEINANNLDDVTDLSRKQEIRDKQLAIVDRLRKYSDITSLKDERLEDDVESKIQKEKEDMDVERDTDLMSGGFF